MPNSIARHATVLLLIVGLVVLLAPASARAENTARFKVTIVKATKNGDSMDPALKKYASLLSGKGYTNFTKKGSDRFSLAVGASKSVSVNGGLKVKFTFKSEVNKRVAFKYQIFSKGQAKPAIHYSIPRGGKTALIIPLGNHAFVLIIEVN